ncbi:MAG: isoleucine--tRNA ligase [Firmicutes bacterium]|nr:isoleucine--tRNA ligase [Bacillota bacterium]
MKNFKELDKRPVSEVESSISTSWESINAMHDAQVAQNENNETFVFYDGPAFANGFPGLHHMVSKNLKDCVTKYHVMNGKKVIRKIGWDTHGLPIENHVEKKLGISSKKEIEALGIEKFNDECRKSVRANEDAFTNLTSKMGQFFDVENPYLTYKNDYIETEWWILKEMFEKNMFYEGTRVVPYCPHCGTGLATHEVAQNYQTDTAITVYVPFKKKNEDVYFLVWTTTPWTLIANVALCVNPDEEYALVESKGTKFILASALVEKVLGEEATILETYQGKDLEYMEYEQLLPSLEVDKKAFFVTCDNYVTMEDGTGIVHIAPAFGEDDALVGKKYDLPYLNPVGKDGCYTTGLWEGKFVHDVNEEIVTYLKENDKLFKKQKLAHEYPHCWRCDTALIYYSMPSYYIRVSEMTDKLVEANSKVNWYPAYVGEKRFANWLANARDWNVSRSRYWGSPIPYWKCECGHAHMIGSIEELKNLAIEEIGEDFDLHKPYIDNVHIKCDKCGKEMTRIPDVLDCWFDSGAMPFAQYHYPFENKELWESQFPADFICEGIDQTRGWFYTLMVISTFVKGCSPFKNVLVNDLLLDANGKKMSKSRGNIVEPFTTIEQYGADTVRFYLPYVSPVWTPLKFDMEGLKEVYSKFFNPLKNTYSFFAMYANIDGIDTDECNVPYENREEIDKWLLSKYNKLVKNVRNDFDEYDLNKVVHHLSTFVSEDLSNWYIRRNRNRFWGSELNESKKSVYITTYEVLVGLSKLIAPIVPFVSEELYRNLTNDKSVHLTSYPVCDESLIDEHIEERMDLVRSLISIGRYVREENKVKVRQPLPEALIDGKNKEVLSDLTNLIMEELNVKNVTFADDLNTYMTFTIKPNFKEVGKVFGKNMGEYQKKLLELSKEAIDTLQKGESINMTVADNEYEITPDMVEIRYNSKEGFNVGMENGNFIILDTRITEKLKMEGNAREFVSKVQSMRKDNGFDIADRIITTYNADEEFAKAIKANSEYVKNETLSVELIKDETLEKDLTLNDYSVGIKLERK